MMISFLFFIAICLARRTTKIMPTAAAATVHMPLQAEFTLPADLVAAAAGSKTPIVVWHGLGDFCENPISMVPFVDFVKNVTGAPVYCLQIGADFAWDSQNSWLMNVNDQIDYACNLITKMTNISSGFYGLGLSQGALFLRGLKQRCPAASVMSRLVSIGGPQQGVESIPQCNSNTTICQWIGDLLDDFAVYDQLVQDFLAPADYWHDTANPQDYLQYSSFLADINNAKATKNATYKALIETLEHFVMVQFTQDTVVYPFQSEHFGFYEDGSLTVLQTLQQSPLYTQDWLGLKTLDKQGKLAFYSVDANHLHFTHQFFVDNLLQYLI